MDPIETIETILANLRANIAAVLHLKEENKAMDNLFEDAKRAILVATVACTINIDDVLCAMQPVEIPK